MQNEKQGCKNDILEQTILVCKKWLANYFAGDTWLKDREQELILAFQRYWIPHSELYEKDLPEKFLNTKATCRLAEWQLAQADRMKSELEPLLLQFASNGAAIDREIEQLVPSLSQHHQELVYAWLQSKWEVREANWGTLYGKLKAATHEQRDGQSENQEVVQALSGKPALSALFDRLGYRRWETIDESDERNLQRLSEILLIHRIEIERPRGERKARLKKLSN